MILPFLSTSSNSEVIFPMEHFVAFADSSNVILLSSSRSQSKNFFGYSVSHWNVIIYSNSSTCVRLIGIIFVNFSICFYQSTNAISPETDFYCETARYACFLGKSLQCFSICDSLFIDWWRSH